MSRILHQMIKILLTLTCAFIILPAPAANSLTSLEQFYEDQFKTYQVSNIKLASKASLQWKNDKKARNYRTLLRQAWKEATYPNFAGHFFAVDSISCGTGCEIIFIIDWNTGKIYYPPEDHSFLVRKNSRLVILKPYEECTAYGPPILFEFRDYTFRKIEHNQCQ